MLFDNYRQFPEKETQPWCDLQCIYNIYRIIVSIFLSSCYCSLNSNSSSNVYLSEYSFRDARTCVEFSVSVHGAVLRAYVK